jgi:hypothetical protein
LLAGAETPAGSGWVPPAFLPNADVTSYLGSYRYLPSYVDVEV